jgi:hypothetical protein
MVSKAVYLTGINRTERTTCPENLHIGLRVPDFEEWISGNLRPFQEIVIIFYSKSSINKDLRLRIPNQDSKLC